MNYTEYLQNNEALVAQIISFVAEPKFAGGIKIRLAESEAMFDWKHDNIDNDDICLYQTIQTIYDDIKIDYENEQWDKKHGK